MNKNTKLLLDDTILYLFQSTRISLFPMDPSGIARRLDRCRYITYDELANTNHIDYRDIVKACCSVDGCTQYDPITERYLIIINTSKRYNASQARIRWTTAHELGHIAAGHFIEIAKYRHAGIPRARYREMEEEANYFAASLLAPIPAMKLMNVKRPAQIRDWFGISQTAAEYRWADMQSMSADQRLEDHFRIFFPKSIIKIKRSMTPIDIEMPVIYE